MGIANRKEREKEDLRNRILQAAMALFQQKGAEQTSIRAIAEQIEYSPTTIYLYFKDKDALFYALHQQGFDQLKEGFLQLLAIADPFERIITQGYGYIDFALKNPHLYDLMFVSEMPMAWLDYADDSWKEGENAFAILKANVQQCIQLGYMPPDDPEIIAFWIWSTLHGMITLHQRQRCDDILSPENKIDCVQKGFAHFVQMLARQKNHAMA